MVLRFLMAAALTASASGSGVVLAKSSSIRHLSPSCLTCLGAPMDIVSTAVYFPLSGFHRVPTVLRQGSKPELLFLGAEDRDLSDIERWPVVKVPDQFGSFARVRPAKRFCGNTTCSVASFNLSLARYTSRYVVFVSKDLADAYDRLYQRPTREELALFNRYARMHVGGSYRDAVLAAAAGSVIGGTRGLPLVTVGGYLQTVSQVMNVGDFKAVAIGPSATNAPGPNLPFTAVQKSLQRGKAIGAYPSLVRDVNSEANIITALICHADHMQPRHVCGRAVIREIVRHVR